MGILDNTRQNYDEGILGARLITATVRQRNTVVHKYVTTC